MICDALSEAEIRQAYRLYVSLHGLPLSEEGITARLNSYFNNEPDETIDDAIWAYADDQVLAPPDVVLERWGKSRVYELEEIATGSWRHRVCEQWFDNGCQLPADRSVVDLGHFWTQVDLTSSIRPNLTTGMRFNFKRIDESTIQVRHREHGIIAQLPSPLAEEIASREGLGLRYLVLFDSLVQRGDQESNKLFVATAAADVPNEALIDYAATAFTTFRNKC